VPYPTATAEQVGFFRDHGWIVVDDAIDPADLNVLEARCTKIIENKEKMAFDWAWEKGTEREDRPFKILQSSPSVFWASEFESAPFRLWAIEFGSALLGKPVEFWYDQFLAKPPGHSVATRWHQDVGYWGRNLDDAGITCWMPFHDVDAGNGCMHFIDEGHKLGVIEHKQPPEIASDLLSDPAPQGRRHRGRGRPLSVEGLREPGHRRAHGAGVPMTHPAGRPDVERALEVGQAALAATALVVAAATERFGATAAAVLPLLLDVKGRVVVTGLGKSGHIGSKLAATLASTGTPAFFVHAADALHGDAGMVCEDDLLLAISNSGRTAEVLRFAEMVRRRGVTVVAMTGCNGDSPLAELAEAAIDTRVGNESDPWDIVPTSSTAVALAVGDALAVALMVARDFGPDSFAEHHPGGALGARLNDVEL
jgi:D-arabinose 5-phosphate isomerase GutQ